MYMPDFMLKTNAQSVRSVIQVCITLTSCINMHVYRLFSSEISLPIFLQLSSYSFSKLLVIVTIELQVCHQYCSIQDKKMFTSVSTSSKPFKQQTLCQIHTAPSHDSFVASRRAVWSGHYTQLNIFANLFSITATCIIYITHVSGVNGILLKCHGLQWGANVFPLVSNVNFWLLVGLSSGSISLVEK